LRELEAERVQEPTDVPQVLRLPSLSARIHSYINKEADISGAVIGMEEELPVLLHAQVEALDISPGGRRLEAQEGAQYGVIPIAGRGGAYSV
jgi:hypothetical protein